jgi:hypothetical protein
MAKDASKVRVALTGSIWTGDEGATLPTTISAAPGAGFTELGYTTEDGVTFTFGREVENLMGWQSTDPLRVLVTEEPKGVEFTLRQLERATFLNSFGGTITEPDSVGFPGEYEWTPPAPGTMPVKVLIVEFDDADIKYRWIFRRAQDQAEREMQLMRTEAVNIPANYTVLAASPQWGKVQSDDPAFAPAA